MHALTAVWDFFLRLHSFTGSSITPIILYRLDASLLSSFIGYASSIGYAISSTDTARSAMSHRIFIVDDHPVMRRGYAYLIGAEMDLEVCGEAASAREALDRIPDAQPDLAIVDLTLKGMGGLELIKRLQSQHPDILILVVSMHDETLYADRALRAGARGYIMKSEVESVVVDAIRRILNGGVHVSDALSTKILLQYAGASPSEEDSPLERLSDRELEVFEYMGRGSTTREIADKLALSPKTIDSYRSRIKEKMAIDSNNELTRRAVLWVESQDQEMP